jgi:Mg/Co/Ni transporter MgtE
MGFSDVHEYVDGKLDWLAAGLPTEGTNSRLPRAGDVARSDAPTCRMDEPIDDVRERVKAGGWDACVVVNDGRVIMGLLRSKELEEQGQPVEHIMRPGPSTFRPHVSILEMAQFMLEHDLPNSPITTSDGRLVGLLYRDDAVRVAHELHAHDDHAHGDTP